MPGPVTISQMTAFPGQPVGTELFPLVATSQGLLTNYNITFSAMASAFLASVGTTAANLVYAGPTSGAAATATFRALVVADIPWTGVTQDLSITAGGTATVVGLQTRSMLSTAPSTGSLLGWTGVAWAPRTLALDINISSTNATSVTVVGIQSQTVMSTVPTAGFLLSYNGTSWQPRGDITIATSLTVNGAATVTSLFVTNLTATNATFANLVSNGSATINNLLQVNGSGVIGTALAVGTSTIPTTGNIYAAGFLNSGGFNRVSANFGVQSSTTLVNVTGLSVNLGTNLTYIFSGSIFASAGSTGGTKLSIVASNSITNLILDMQAYQASALVGQARFTASGGSFTLSAATTPTINFSGLITVGNNTSTINMQIAQVAATTTTTFALAGSFMNLVAVN